MRPLFEDKRSMNFRMRWSMTQQVQERRVDDSPQLYGAYNLAA
jgi:hypothetical protein